MKAIYQYFVEGEDEKRLIEILKTDLQVIWPGKVQVVNVTQERLTDLKLRVLSEGTILIFVFDTDAGNVNILNDNIQKARKANNVKRVYCITQVKNLEDELIRSTDIKDIVELLGSESLAGFKKDFIKEKNLKNKLEAHSFNIGELWSMDPPEPFHHIRNDSDRVKKP